MGNILNVENAGMKHLVNGTMKIKVSREKNEGMAGSQSANL